MNHCKNIFTAFILFIIYPVVCSFSANANWGTASFADNPAKTKTAVSGKVSDKETGELLIGATIYIPDLKLGAVTDTNGIYFLNNLPNSRVLVQVSFIGYKTITETIDFSLTGTRDFALEPSVREMDETVITGISQATERSREPIPVSVIPKITLLQNSSSNIIDAIATQPGISQITTGTGISKPVIRGLGFNRVVVVNDGIRQEGQQWGDEHGVEIDEYSVSKVEILKGPGSLSYGSDAMAGVINMISAPAQPGRKINGNILGNYQSNNGMIGYSVNISGNNKAFTLDGRYSEKMAHAYQNKYDGFILNSGYKENNFGVIIGLNKSWGYSHLNFSTYHLSAGITEGKRDSATGKFLKPVALNDTTGSYEISGSNDFTNYAPSVPLQEIRHNKISLNSSFVAGKGIFKSILGFQQNLRQEFTNILTPDDYGLFFHLVTLNYDFRYIFPEKNNWNISLGMNGMLQRNQNKGKEFLIPAYQLLDAGGFVLLKRNSGKFDFSGGLRYDTRNINSEELIIYNGIAAEEKFKHFQKSFSSAAGSIGESFSFNDHFILKMNLSRGFRAPNQTELSSNGVHEGTARYVLGNVNLRPETSMQEDLGIIIKYHHISIELDVFINSIRNYIFLHKLSSVNGGDSITLTGGNPFPSFTYSPGQALLSGGEILMDVHPHPFDWLHFENSFSYVQAVQGSSTDSTKYLPFTPAPKQSSVLRADVNFKKGENRNRNIYTCVAYFKIGMDNYFRQEKFYSAYNTETGTPSYMLLNLGTGASVVSKGKTIFSLFVNINNLLDVAYQSHLSRLKYTDENFATGRKGIYNMGRNISVKIVVPVG